MLTKRELTSTLRLAQLFVEGCLKRKRFQRSPSGQSVAKTNRWTIGLSEQFRTDSPQLTSENHDDRDANAKRPGFQFNFPQDVLNRAELAAA